LSAPITRGHSTVIHFVQFVRAFKSIAQRDVR
jgi:hypothetical protein